MRLILERQEIIEILEKHFEEKFDSNQIVIRTEPFEIELMKLSMPTEPTPAKPPSAPTPKPGTLIVAPPSGPRMENGFLVEPPSIIPEDPSLLERRSSDGEAAPPPLSADEVGSGPVIEGGSPASLIQRSRELAAEIDRKNPGLTEQNQRIRRGNIKEPGADFDKEV
jgi:hypothetical protein